MTKNSNVIEHFLLIYDRKEDKLLSCCSHSSYFRGFTAHDLQQLVDSLSFE